MAISIKTMSGKGETEKKLALDFVEFLVVDDYAFLRRIVTDHLKSYGAKFIHHAEDGAEAVGFLRLKSPTVKNSALANLIRNRGQAASEFRDEAPRDHRHCVITDFSMPHGNGLQLLKAIRCGETHVPRDTPVILLTGFAEHYVIAAAMALDVSGFIVKPVSQKVLGEKLAYAMREKIDLKEPEEYGKVELPDEKGQTLGSAAKVPQAFADRDGGEGEDIRWLPVGSILPGSVLARDLCTDVGALLLKAGAVLTASALQRLLDANAMRALSGNIPIRN